MNGDVRRNAEMVGSAVNFSAESSYGYDASLDRWTRPADLPHASGLGVSGVIGGKLYVPGYDNRYLSKVRRIGRATSRRPVFRRAGAASVAPIPAGDTEFRCS
jgi:hypothetical protein